MRSLNSWLPHTGIVLEVSYFMKYWHKTEKEFSQEASNHYARKRFVAITQPNQILFSFVLLEQVIFIQLLSSGVFHASILKNNRTKNKKYSLIYFIKNKQANKETKTKQTTKLFNVFHAKYPCYYCVHILYLFLNYISQNLTWVLRSHGNRKYIYGWLHKCTCTYCICQF